MGGMNAPPKIIMIKKPDAWLVYFPKPAVANEKMQGHMIEQNKPPVKNAYTLSVPVLSNPMSMAIVPNVPRSSV